MPSEGVSLNKFISDTGFCSRREADKLIIAGRVTIDLITAKPGNRVIGNSSVLVDGQPLVAKKKSIYLAFHKPLGISSTTDLKDKHNIIDFIDHPERIFPIGRLDKDSEGLIFLTNDGDIVNKILRAGNNHQKEYVVTVDKPIGNDFIRAMSNGVKILESITQKCLVKQEQKNVFRIILTQGLNRQIRRMCQALGYRVIKLVRVRIMHITLAGLQAGKWRYLTNKEIGEIEMLVKDSSKTA